MINPAKRTAVLASLVIVILTVGCGGEKKAKNTTPVANPTQTSKAVDVSGAAEPAPLPPTPSAATSPASGVAVVNASGDVAAQGDVLFRFRKSPTGEVLDDVGAYQQAIDLYGVRADITEEPGKQPWPNLRAKPDLTLLVKSGLLTALPTPPSGQKFVFNSQTMKVSLAPQ